MKRLLPLLLLSCAAAACTTVPGERAAAPAPSAAFASERIGVTVRGEGPDVVLIPGLSSSPAVWDSTIAALPGYRYHIVHVSGFAGRPAGANASGPVVEPVGEEIARYIREAGLRQPAVVGHSMGGFWGMQIAARHPGLVGKLMVVDMMPFVGAMFGANAQTVRPIADQIRAGMTAATPEQRDANLVQNIDTMVKTESLRPIALRHSRESDEAVSTQAFYDLIVTDLTPEIARIQVPMTVLWARNPSAPVTESQMAGYYRAAYSGVPQARVVNVPDSYHFIMWDNPTMFQSELRTFLGAR